MAELLGISSGIAGLLALSGAILSKGYTYISSVRGAPEELRFLLNETAALNIVLSQLSQLAANAGAKNSGNNGVFSTLSSLSSSGVIDQCTVLLEAVARSIKSCEQLKGEELNNFKKKLIFPFREREVKETLRRLGSLRETFTAAISVDTMWVFSTVLCIWPVVDCDRRVTVQRVEKRVGDIINDLKGKRK